MTSTSIHWKRVDVGLPDSSEFEETMNHYDDSKLRKRAKNDLEADPGEDVAMFFGLEVIDGNDYQVVTKGSNKKVIFRKEEESANSSTRKVLTKGKKYQIADVQDQEDVGDQRHEPSDKKFPSVMRPSHVEDQAAEKPVSKKDQNSNQARSETSSESKKKRTKKAKEKRTEISTNDSEVDPAQISALQDSWMLATGGVVLKDSICHSLLLQNFFSPTPIQATTLAASILGRRNIVGAAPTGSGKTLAYLLPILQELRDQKILQALILTPTRELALQVSHECSKITPKSCGTLVGGLAVAKQARVLTQRPPILVATAGRLWELMSSNEHQHLNELSQIRFLVVDEADRMIQQGSFPELVKIFDAIHFANPLEGEKENQESDDDDEDGDRMLGLPGIRGEAKVVMLDDMMQRFNQQSGDSSEAVAAQNDTYDDFMTDQDDQDTDHIGVPPTVHRQTFVFSATLTLPPSDSHAAKQKLKGKKDARKLHSVDNTIADILEKTRSHGLTKRVDLTSSTKLIGFNKFSSDVKETGQQESALSSLESPRLPPGLSLLQIQCTQKHKDSHLYAYLVTTAQGASGPCLVFCNSISGVRRVGATLQTLRLPVRMLHANMEQKARFKAVESINKPKSRCIVVATDIAARGLDIPSVATVVHYDVARQVDTFIHRAGRTARGMGVGAVGTSISLVAPGEDKSQARICEALGSKRLFQVMPLDGRLLSEAQVRVNLASKIVECENLESKTQKQNQWFQKAADEAGLEVDDGLIEEGLAGGDKRERQQLQTAKQARSQLRLLLAQPMTTQRYGKFLSSNSAAMGLPVPPHVVPLDSQLKERKRKGRS